MEMVLLLMVVFFISTSCPPTIIVNVFSSKLVLLFIDSVKNNSIVSGVSFLTSPFIK